MLTHAWERAIRSFMGNTFATDLRRVRANMLGGPDEEHYWHCHAAADEIDRLDLALQNAKAAFRANMIRLAPNYSHADFDKAWAQAVERVDK